MTDSRRDLLQVLAQISELDPHVRLGQLLTNLATMARGPKPESVWDGEDEELLAAGERLLERLRERQTAVAR
jgi:hypothetical protein